jgi:hypothetical protein
MTRATATMIGRMTIKVIIEICDRPCGCDSVGAAECVGVALTKRVAVMFDLGERSVAILGCIGAYFAGLFGKSGWSGL